MLDRRLTRQGLPALLCAGAIVCAMAAPSLAAADTFCVQPEASCAPANTHATVQGALNAANVNGAGVRDTVLLGATTYTENVSDAGGNPVDIIGKGTGQTTITSPGGFGTTTFAIGEGSSTVSALSIQIPGGGNNTGLALVGDANGIAVTEQGGDFGHVGVDLQNSGARLNGSTVTMTAGTAAQSFSGGTVRDSRLSGSGGSGGSAHPPLPHHRGQHGGGFRRWQHDREHGGATNQRVGELRGRDRLLGRRQLQR